MKKNERPTLKTIADKTGLAVTTVSRALLGDKKIALKTRERVEEAAKDINYIPDRAAQRLRTGKTKVLSLVLSPHQESIGFGNSLIIGLTRAMLGSDYHLNITPSFSKEDELSPIESIVKNKLSDGVIFTRTRHFDSRISYLLDKDYPFVSHGRSEFSEQHSYVDYDNHLFAYEAVKRLVLKKGCKNVCIILPPKILTFSQHIFSGFTKAIQEFNIDYEIPSSITLDSKPHDIRAWMNNRIKNGNIPDGYVCAGESSFLAINYQLRMHFSVEKVMSDYHFVVKSTTGILDQLPTTVDQIIEDIESSGEHLGKQILHQLTHSLNTPLQTVLSPKLNFLD